jgi:hypothetical protein
VAEQGRRRGMAAAVVARPCTRRRAGEHGGMERARALWSRVDAISVPDSAGGGAEGGCRRGGGSGFHRRRWRHGVLVAGVLEGGERVAGMLLRDDVVLLVPLVGAEGRCSIGSTVRPSGAGA